MLRLKLMVIGDARHGKDTVCNILVSNFNLTFVSSSYFVAEKAVRPYLERMGLVYNNLEDCYADRINHRPDWYNAISEYNREDPAKLGKELFAQYDIYCGIRNIREFIALKQDRAFDICLGVDASKREPPEARTSNTIGLEHADIIIDNNGPESALEQNVIHAYRNAQAIVMARQRISYQ